MRTEKNNYHGILLLDKAIGLSSNQALQKVKKLLHIRKAGHTGSLDPLATGMLPICLGEATKFSQFLLDSDKTYQVEAQLGIITETGDAEGKIVSQKPVPTFTKDQILTTLNKFKGAIQQVPSMYSALKFNGKPLYAYARQGIEVERKAREVIIHRIELINFTNDRLNLEISCSKGTYIRTLVEDIGNDLGCGAYVTQLRRLSVANFPETAMVNLENLDLKHLLPIQSIVEHYPKVYLTPDMVFYLKQGQSVFVPKTSILGHVQLYLKDETFVGIGLVLPNGMIAPKRLVK